KFSWFLKKVFIKFYTFFIAFSIKILQNTSGRFQKGLKRNSDARRRGCCRVCRLVLALWLSEI
ncbi:MAG: hypothetical protein Q3X79_09705, partial [Fusicatenibacter sp.]|nr:hypothetical protein [Fusicatenibacter sp.]